MCEGHFITSLSTGNKHILQLQEALFTKLVVIHITQLRVINSEVFLSFDCQYKCKLKELFSEFQNLECPLI